MITIKRAHPLLRTFMVCVLACACGHETKAPGEADGSPSTSQGATAAAELKQITDELWQYQLAHNTYLQMREGIRVREIPDLTLAEAERDTLFAQDLLRRLAVIDTAALNHEDWLTHQILTWQLSKQVDGFKYYWLSFIVTPYNTYDMAFAHQVLAAYPLKSVEDRQAYLGLLDEYAAMLGQMRDKTRGQAERGIRIPQLQLPAVIGLHTSYRDRSEQLFGVQRDRLADVESAAASKFVAAVEEKISRGVRPAFDRLIGCFDEDYRKQAPAGVGVSQYPDGKEFYRYLVRLHTTLDLSPEEVFAYGQTRMSEIAREMQALRDQLGFKGSQAAFHQMLRTDRRFLAKTPAEVEQRYLNYVHRVEPMIPKYFTLKPKTPYGVRRLDLAAESGMTFGYYQPATPDNPIGEYRYNGSQLDQRSLVGAMALIYHELIPGHHFHLALQGENEALPKVRREGASFGAFNEGWAEYAASLAGEMGLLEDPYDRYGRLLMDAFLTSRLVVDPGLNHFGWSLEQARAYMAERTFLSPVEIASETLRYSTDIPGQALGYKIGQRTILELRREAEQSMGDAFDIRDFHTIVLGSGGMPMSVLQQHVQWYVAQERAAQRAGR